DGLPTARSRPMAQVEVLAVQEVRAVEPTERVEHPAADRHEGPIYPVDRMNDAAPACPQPSEARVADEMCQHAEACRRRLPGTVVVHEPAARDAGARARRERVDEQP